ncbi:MAG TPA: hypothetical protein DEO40_05640 [Treponema sp.]|nr:DUF2400 family protein [Treponema sp.]HBB42743.1 hypothetical protein [Treponema sp.]HCA20141.1 hypothetical protein [Treponema sp.]
MNAMRKAGCRPRTPTSANKRINMLLRWMRWIVRKNFPVDSGLRT